MIFAWLYAQWLLIPAPIREPLRSAGVTAALAAQTMFWGLFGSAAQDGHLTSLTDFLGYVWMHSWGYIVGILLPIAYRSRQSFTAATKTITTDSYVSVPLTVPPKGGP